MISDLDIEGLGVIERAELPLGPGFTAITGETGAGKTMVVTALGLVLGGRAQPGTVRAGAAKAQVTARWTLPLEGGVAALVDAAGGELDPLGAQGEVTTPVGELLVSRSISGSDGRSRARLGGANVPASTLGTLAEHLVVVHGQSDQLRLRSERAQREALDAFGGEVVAIARRRVAELFERARLATAELELLTSAREAREREAAQLRELAEAIEPVSPTPGEDQALLQRIERLEHREELRHTVAEAQAILGGGEVESADAPPSVARLLDDVRLRLERAAGRDPSLASAVESVGELAYGLQEAVIRLGGYLDGLDLDGVGELEALNERLSALTDLSRRYGPTLDDVIERFDDAGRRLLELDGDDDRLAELQREAEAANAELTEAAAALTTARQSAAAELSTRVTAELAALAMPNARFEVGVTPADEMTAHGADRIAFLLTPHPGASPAPVQKGASGGELSRVMLALEVVIAAANPVPTLVFDEVDAGVGGAAAIEIGRRLASLAEHAQVIAVTHLAQVAAFATNHVQIEKASDGEVTTSSIRALTGEARVAEITRLLSGLDASETGRAHAEELLALAAGRTQV